MKRLKRLSSRLGAIPVPATLFVLAMGLFAMGAYIASPWYVPTAPLNSTFDSDSWSQKIFGISYVVLACWGWVGTFTKSRRIVLQGSFLIMMGYLFLSILRVVVVGWLPPIWLPLFICALVAGICRLALLYNRE